MNRLQPKLLITSIYGPTLYYEHLRPQPPWCCLAQNFFESNQQNGPSIGTTPGFLPGTSAAVRVENPTNNNEKLSSTRRSSSRVRRNINHLICRFDVAVVSKHVTKAHGQWQHAPRSFHAQSKSCLSHIKRSAASRAGNFWLPPCQCRDLDLEQA